MNSFLGCSLRVAALLLALLGAALAERRTVLYVPLDERFATDCAGAVFVDCKGGTDL